MKTVLITGAAGFIGNSLAVRMMQSSDKYKVVGVDNLNDYYDISLKKDRLKRLQPDTVRIIDIADKDALETVFEEEKIDIIINLAAQAGVRYAKENPESYIHSNIQGFFTICELAVKYNVKSLIYASSSSVYGSTTTMPFSEDVQCNTPMSLYAATKLANEALASSYFYTHNLRTIGLRFFNVYGPWGRPDMAYYKWTELMAAGREIELRNNGEMWRDMTYIDDVVEVIIKLCDSSRAPKAPLVFNVGNRDPIKINDTMAYLADQLKVTPLIKNAPKGSEEPIKTWADTKKLDQAIGFVPNTPYQQGLERFLNWYREYHEI